MFKQVIVIKENNKYKCKTVELKIINEELVDIASKKYNKPVDEMRKILQRFYNYK